VRHIEDEVVAVAERLAAEQGDESIVIPCFQHDVARRRVLESRGYERTDAWGVLRRLRLGSGPLPEAGLPAGYRIRSTLPVDEDHQLIADLLNAAFGRDIHHAGETRGFQAHAPSYRRDLDLVAEAPDGVFASYSAVCWDDHNKHAIFEPVCTHPEHRGRGLAKALMFEGLRRARGQGAIFASVETGSAAAANALYDSIGFAEEYRADGWSKAL
jgi:ribosomal protein S18 acetylase RimI-like enzyme